jgi:hypothetical protein
MDDVVLKKAAGHLEDATTALLHALSKLTDITNENESETFDPITPMAAALRSVSVASGLLEALHCDG